MKKQILLMASIAISGLAMAQSKPVIGIKAGLSSSELSGDAVNSLQNVLDFTNGNISTSRHTGIFGGAYINVPVSGNISIEPGLYYTQKGYQLNGELNMKGLEFLGANAKAELTSQYIDLPVLVKASF